jgi:hypothetical protein
MKVAGREAGGAAKFSRCELLRLVTNRLYLRLGAANASPGVLARPGAESIR